MTEKTVNNLSKYLEIKTAFAFKRTDASFWQRAVFTGVIWKHWYSDMVCNPKSAGITNTHTQSSNMRKGLYKK